MTKTGRPVDVLCIYRVKEGQDGEFRKLLERHGPALRAAGLTGTTPKIWKATSGRKPGSIYVELMQWKDEHAASAAHQMREVMAVWEPMGNLTESMEFLDLHPAGIGEA